MDNELDQLVTRVKHDLHKRKASGPLGLTEPKKPKKIRLDSRLIPPGCFQVILTPSGYSIGLDAKLTTGHISYGQREILDAIESGKVPDMLSDWIQHDKVKIKDGGIVKCAIVEKSNEGTVLSTRVIDLQLQSHG